MRIGIAGWFGSDNLGDELLLHALMGSARAAAPAASFVVLCPEPARVTALHGVDAIHLPTLRAKGSANRQGVVTRALRGCDLLLLGPGTVFQERSPNLPWPGTLPMFARIVAMARLAGTPVAVAGAGVREGGTVAGRRLLRVIGAGCASVGVRDARSAGYFGRSARVIGDLAYTLALPDRPAVTGDRFAVSMRPLAPAVEGPLLAALSGATGALATDGWSGAFLPMAYGRGAQGEDDAVHARALPDLADAVANPLEGGGPFGPALDDWLRRLGAHRLVLGVRLHAVLLAVAMGVPTVAIAYERKVHDAFVDLGLERYVVGTGVDAGTLHRTARAAVDDADTFAVAAKRLAEQGAVAKAFVAGVVAG
ncbi:polysaccharide pyruvyl transferase WcaK-like protein [Asanoa ferruginea]|uniref:Polysaccharide pyruvyl transferase WcaK-like protein n=1 Tax=Asanoa ferruginea TaxID=53367 RepID=A0A3D9ZW16_9ACTN|nr:polysaccharide pyruvyl transferase family protein [Asanoa ferruginea]REG00294.1 polysaccharide pyruvyl transferase WcaK-like protein [Asanoa ferruginea]GIF52137.1 polysaccharide pyruvyl transferase CsaB [Asanoa ferruginea]